MFPRKGGRQDVKELFEQKLLYVLSNAELPSILCDWDVRL